MNAQFKPKTIKDLLEHSKIMKRDRGLDDPVMNPEGIQYFEDRAEEVGYLDDDCSECGFTVRNCTCPRSSLL